MGDSVALYVLDARLRLEYLHHTVVGTDGIGVDIVVFYQVVHLDMSAEARHLVSDGVLETQHYTDGDNHHHQSDGDTHDGYTDGRTTHFAFVALITIDSFCYKKREIQRV